MKSPCPWLPPAAFVLSHATITSCESITASGLLGSHFGIPGLNATYDYVVIGGGTAGLAVARRLAETPSVSVAVIEAGDFPQFSNGNYSEVPAYASEFTGSDPTLKNPALDWYMYTTPQEALFDSGKIISGSSGRNFLWQVRGTHGCFDRWAQEVDDPSYQYESFLPYFQRYAHFHLPNATNVTYNLSDWSPHGGPVQVGYPSWANLISAWLGRGFTEMGMQALPSLLSGNLMGWSWLSQTLDPVTQTRSSSLAFLEEALAEASNLVLYKSTLAKKITFRDEQATGVLVDTAGQMYHIAARGEVVLSAGVMRSPQLLMVSGIGPQETLQAHGIPVIADRPGVGQNMADNVLVGPTYQVRVTTHNSLADPAYLAASVEEYNVNRTGMLTNVGGDVAAFEKIPPSMLHPETSQALNDSFPSDWPHIEYLVLDEYFATGADSSRGVSNMKQYVAASVGLVATFSRGNVTIASSDAATNPIISPNWLLDPRDQDVALAAFTRARQLFNTSAMQPVVVSEAFPGATYTTRADLLRIIRESANSVYNAVGTNRMGRATDREAVVDSRCRVIGVENLRVVDASAFPFLPPGQPSATVYALAEKIAADMRESE
ncbi:glucose-methanol-choline oxidoreductase [Aspergillus sclerotioniger CBS 115572]|uniref:Glucose-methanol-choline oxidoreductase n=1 Tax=Aspergillus sclerotioniger CBS 115572 TaxID=1450535 RepID=A0A317WTR8_9EURO|nr:glucose-methanol-choline oxidoreductase [Aspergillus sclerotioniger CBS 115572]PWY88672.1 glucose-methanol-choline oxidoreductase [Aspergillus sclerotioniger CBS 115572]